MKASELIEKLVEYTLEMDKYPSTVFKFCKWCEIEESDFYKYFSSIQSVKEGFCKEIVSETIVLLQKEESFEGSSSHHQMLSFYFTLFEHFTLNRSYILMVCDLSPLEHFELLKALRKQIVPVFNRYSDDFATVLNKFSTDVGQKFTTEALWFQFVGIFKFWMKDTSVDFESTDAFIEKSLKLTSDLTKKLPFDSLLDYGKFVFNDMKASL